MNSTVPVGARATASIARPWTAAAIWKTPFDPKREPIFAPRRMKAAIAKVLAVIAVPTLVAAMFRSPVMPAIETVSALTANEAWICVSTTMMRGSQDVFVVTLGCGAHDAPSSTGGTRDRRAQSRASIAAGERAR